LQKKQCFRELLQLAKNINDVFAGLFCCFYFISEPVNIFGSFYTIFYFVKKLNIVYSNFFHNSEKSTNYFWELFSLFHHAKYSIIFFRNFLSLFMSQNQQKDLIIFIPGTFIYLLFTNTFSSQQGTILKKIYVRYLRMFVIS
jgi:hypothetical protein